MSRRRSPLLGRSLRARASSVLVSAVVLAVAATFSAAVFVPGSAVAAPVLVTAGTLTSSVSVLLGRELPAVTIAHTATAAAATVRVVEEEDALVLAVDRVAGRSGLVRRVPLGADRAAAVRVVVLLAVEALQGAPEVAVGSSPSPRADFAGLDRAPDEDGPGRARLELGGADGPLGGAPGGARTADRVARAGDEVGATASTRSLRAYLGAAGTWWMVPSAPAPGVFFAGELAGPGAVKVGATGAIFGLGCCGVGTDAIAAGTPRTWMGTVDVGLEVFEVGEVPFGLVASAGVARRTVDAVARVYAGPAPSQSAASFEVVGRLGLRIEPTVARVLLRVAAGAEVRGARLEVGLPDPYAVGPLDVGLVAPWAEVGVGVKIF